MESYQVLSLIGCIFGILLTIGLFLLVSFLTGTSDYFFNMTRPTEQERTLHETSNSVTTPFLGGTVVAFFLYIAMLVITFVVKSKVKVLGILLLAIGAICVAITNGWGIIPFALLLPAGIVALRHKPKTVATV
jgi:Protein of unknown function (DUF4064)